MATGIRFPVDLPPPSRDGYSSAYEVNVSRQDREIGSARQRRTTRTQPRIESLSFSFTEAEYLIFDTWWQETIKSGELLFDILLSDDLGGFIWYTARWINDYEASIDNSRYDWNIKGTLRLMGAGFAVRVSGTDELHGLATLTSFGKGGLIVESILRGRSTVESSGRAKFSEATLLGLSETESNGRGKLGMLVLHGISSTVTNGEAQLGVLVLRGISTTISEGTGELGILQGLSSTTSEGKGEFA
jgi:hypothetical protein